MTTLLLESPDHLSPEQRAAEIATILARCLLRQHADREPPVRLGFLPDQRVHTTPYPPEKNV